MWLPYLFYYFIEIVSTFLKKWAMSLVKYMSFYKWCFDPTKHLSETFGPFHRLEFFVFKKWKSQIFSFFSFFSFFRQRKQTKVRLLRSSLLTHPCPTTSILFFPRYTLPPSQAFSPRAYKTVTTNMVGAPALFLIQLDPRRPCRTQTTFAPIQSLCVAPLYCLLLLYWHHHPLQCWLYSLIFPIPVLLPALSRTTNNNNNKRKKWFQL